MDFLLQLYREKEFVLVSQEIDYLENYIELQKIRYHKNVEIRFDCDLDAPLKIAPLLCIILVENAFKHGVQPEVASRIHIVVDVSKPTRLLFTIENSVHPTLENQQIGGYGLQATKERLQLAYPSMHQLDFESSKERYAVTLTLHT